MKALPCIRKSDAVIPEIINRVIFSKESITDDPDWAERRRNVEALEGGDTGAAAVEDVVSCREREVVAGEGEGYVGEGGDFIAVDCVGSVP